MACSALDHYLFVSPANLPVSSGATWTSGEECMGFMIDIDEGTGADNIVCTNYYEKLPLANNSETEASTTHACFSRDISSAA